MLVKKKLPAFLIYIFYFLLYNKNMKINKLFLISILVNTLVLSSCNISDVTSTSLISYKEGYRSLFFDDSISEIIVKDNLKNFYKVGSKVKFSVIDKDNVDEEIFLNNKKLNPYLEESINGINYISFEFVMPDEDVVISCILNKHIPLNEVYPFINNLSSSLIKEVYFSEYGVGSVNQISRVNYTNNKSDINDLINMLNNCYVLKDNYYGGFISGGNASYLDIHLLDNTIKTILINNHYINNASGYNEYFIKNYNVQFNFGETYKCFLPPISSIDKIYYNGENIGGIKNLIIDILFVEEGFELSEKYYLVRSDFFKSDILVYDKNHFIYNNQKCKTVGDKDFSILFTKFNYI